VECIQGEIQEFFLKGAESGGLNSQVGELPVRGLRPPEAEANFLNIVQILTLTVASLERAASPRRICAVTRGFQTTTQDLSVFPFLPRHYQMTRVLLSPFIVTVWTPVVLAIINIISATLKMFMMMIDDDGDDV